MVAPTGLYVIPKFYESLNLFAALKKAFPLSGKRLRCSRKAAFLLFTAQKITDAPHPTPHQSPSVTASPQGEAFFLCTELF